MAAAAAAVPAVSVVIRAKDEAPSIGRTLDLLARQTIADRVETIVVDSGLRYLSTDLFRT